MPRIVPWLLLMIALGCAATLRAAVLPDDRADALYHRYEGGGIEIQGPSIVLRKKIGDSVSLSYNYYVDSITGHVDTVTGASVDAVSGASEYKERRTQHSVSADLLHGKTTYSGGYIGSKENDYDSKTGYLSVSQDMFGDLTTVSFGYTFGKDVVGERGNPAFALDPAHRVTRRNWQVGLSQVLTRNLRSLKTGEGDVPALRVETNASASRNVTFAPSPAERYMTTALFDDPPA